LFLFQIQNPQTHNFDEFHYVPAAKEFLEGKTTRNWEHPPLPKYFIALGIKAFGDEPLGWRVGSAVAGSLTLVAVFQLGVFFWGSLSPALFCVLITLLNQMIVVQSRIGMLDPYMVAFMLWGIFFGLKSGKNKFHIYLSGVFFGLAIASKWIALLAPLTFLFLNFKGKIKNKFILLTVMSGAYVLVFIPLFMMDGFKFSFAEFIPYQWSMWKSQTSQMAAHGYQSVWYQWIMLIRPMWFSYESIENKFVRGVLLIGNPLIMWSGLVGILYVFFDFLRKKSELNKFILIFYTVFAFCWIGIPRSVSFYYYYYPASFLLSFALTSLFYDERQKKVQWGVLCFGGFLFLQDYGLHLSNRNLVIYILLALTFSVFFGLYGLRIEKLKSVSSTPLRIVYLVLVTLIFISFFPLLMGIKFPSASFQKLMWFTSWI